MDQSFVSPYLCQTNQSISTAILQLRSGKYSINYFFFLHPNFVFDLERQRVFHKQIRFMATNNNHTIQYGTDVRLNCYAQYYSEKVRFIQRQTSFYYESNFRQWTHPTFRKCCGSLNVIRLSNEVSGISIDRQTTSFIIYFH